MNRGGAETMIMNLFRNIDRDQIQFDFVENSLEEGAYDREILSLGGRIFHCIHWNGKNHLAYVRWWKRFFEEHAGEYPIVHGHIGSTAAIYLQIAKKSGAFTIAHSHNTLNRKDLKSLFYQAISYPTRYIADYFLACSTEAGNSRFGQSVVRSKRYALLQNAIDTRVFRFDVTERKRVRNELGYSENEIIIGHVGRFEVQKNHQFLVEIFAELVKYNDQMRLLLVGDGKLKEKIVSDVCKFNVRDKVRFLGVRSDVNSLLQGMDAFVFPSLYEGLGVTLIEAQTAGLPCIISDVIPHEAVMAEELVSMVALNKSKEVWAKQIVNSLMRKSNRRDYSSEVAAKGYDIHTTSKWLEGFYLEHIRK